jgi:hypothetical protein
MFCFASFYKAKCYIESCADILTATCIQWYSNINVTQLGYNMLPNTKRFSNYYVSHFSAIEI